ncbi:MAG TPA: LuxR C-terminal-related transcriptional regulator [Pyrinomonadaceae bacterium]
MTLRRSIVIYGLTMAALLALLKLIEYQFFIRDLSLEMYLGLVAVIFVVLGVWAGTRLTRVKIVKVDPDFEVDAEQVKRLGITKREYEVLCLIAAGLSNQEIADKLFVSTSTIKTHTSSIFQKLDASRRTQAIQKAKELRILR